MWPSCDKGEWYVSENENIYARADGIFEQERKMQYLRTSHWSVVPNESSRDFGPCDPIWTQLNLRCFQIPPFLPVWQLGREMSGPKPFETDPTPTHSSRPPLSIQHKISIALNGLEIVSPFFKQINIFCP